MRKWGIPALILVLLAAMLATPVSASGGRSHKLTVVFKDGTAFAAAVKNVEQTGAKVVSSVPEVGMLQVEGTAATMQALQKVAGVQAVAPTIEWKLQVGQVKPLEEAPAATLNPPGDLYNLYQWDIKQVTRNGTSWNLNGGSHQTVVGIIDTGVNAAHSALAANFMGGRNFVPAGLHGDPTETGDPNDYADRHGHGSHVAGTIAGNGRIYGVGPNLGFRSYRVFGASGGASSDWITAAMVSAANDGVDVISMSLGGYDVLGKVTWTDPDTGTVYDLGDDHADLIAYKRALYYVISKNVLVVAAAGNEAIDISSSPAIIDYLNQAYGPDGYHFSGHGIEVPGGIPGTMAVSATGPGSILASYSNWGKGVIAVTAPGGDFQRYPVGNWFTDMCLSSYKTGYVWMAGTSMATPKVSGAAAVYIDQYKKTHGGKRPLPLVTAAALARSATDIGARSYDPLFGFGMLDVYKALSGSQRGNDN